MSNQANYAAEVRNSVAQLSVANTNRDGTGTLVPVMAAGRNGARVDRVQFQAVGTTTAGMVRLFKTKGKVGATIDSLTSSTTTVTVVTKAPHGLSNGNKVYMLDCFPEEYNAVGAVITVTNPTTFTYQAAVASTTAAASTLGYFLSTAANPPSSLWREIPVTAVTPTGVISAWSAYASSATDVGYLPLQLAFGWLLQAATNNAEAINIDCSYGNY